MAATALKKPTAKSAPAPKLAGKAKTSAAKPKVAAKPKAEAKPIAPFEDGQIVIFKGYAQANPDGLFTPEEELAVVGQREDNGQTFVALVKVAEYHAYKKDPEAVNGEEVAPAEIKRTKKSVEEPYHLPVVGDMTKILNEDNGDPLAQAQRLYSQAAQNFFYLGGMFAKLWKETDDTGNRLFTVYKSTDGKNYTNDNDGFAQFIGDHFNGAELIGGFRKVKYYISIYEAFASLPNAGEVVADLAKIGWWKAALMASYVTEDNATALIEKAQEQSSKAFEATLKTEYTTEGSTPQGKAASRATIKRTTFEFKLYEDQGEGVSYVLEAAKKQLGMSDLNAVFETIVMQWAESNLGDTAGKAKGKVEAARKKLVKAGVKLPENHPGAAAEAQTPAA